MTTYLAPEILFIRSLILFFCLQANLVSAQVEAPAILIQNISIKEYAASCQNWEITSNKEGTLFVANNSGLLVFDGNTWTNFELPDQSPVRSVILYQDTIFTTQPNDFGYWITTPEGIYIYHSLQKLIPDFRPGKDEFNYLCVQDDMLWLKSENRLLQYKAGAFTRAFLNTSRDPFDQQANEETHLLSKLPAPLLKKLTDYKITTVLKVEHILFIGTRYNGLFLADENGTVIQHYSTRNQLQDNNIHSIYRQNSRYIWLALDNGISLLSLHSPVTLLKERSEIGKLLHASLQSGELLLETNQGTFKQSLTSEGPFLKGPYTDSTALKIAKEERSIWEKLPKQLLDTLPPIRKLIAENEQIIWGLLSDNTVCRLRLSPLTNGVESLTIYTKKNGIAAPIITDIALIDNLLVLATPQGLFRYDQVRDSFFLYEQLNTQLEEYAIGKMIFSSPDAHYWVSLGNEAALFSIKDGNAQLKCRVLFNNYDMNVVNREQRIIPLSDSLHLVSAMQGVLLINTRRLIEHNLSNQGSPIRISQLKYRDDSGIHFLPLDTKEVTLSSDFRELSIQASTSVLTPTHQISYKLEGISTHWSPWQQDGTISFLQLPKGHYILKIRKYVVKGPFPEISLPIEILPPWYGSMWAYVFYILLLWALLQGSLHYYLKAQRKKEEEVERTRLQAEEQTINQRKSKVLETELQNKNNELTLQASALVRKNQAMQVLQEELEHQKEVLGDRYPNKLYTKMKLLIEGNLNDQADWLLFESYFNSAHQHFIDRLRTQYEELTVGDLRICCLLRMNLSTKEIASMLNVSIRSVELRRYRLRKRLSLEGEDNLVEFLLSF